MAKVKFMGNAPSGFEGYGKEVYEVADKLLANFKEYGNYEIEVVESSSGSGVPTMEWTKNEIMDWLKDNGMKFSVRDSKSELIGIVGDV